MNILVNVINQKLKIKANTKRLVSGTQKFIRFEFNFDDAWDNLLVFAQFIQDGKAYNDYLDENNSVYLPPEIIEGKFNVLLYGSGSNVIATTNYLTFEVDKNMLISDAQSTEITESLYNKLVNIVRTYASQSVSGAPTPVSSSSLMTDPETIYLYTGSEDNYIKGDWYYFSWGQLQHGGTYGVGVTDSSLTIEGAAADSKAVGDAFDLISETIDDIESSLSFIPSFSWEYNKVISASGVITNSDYYALSNIVSCQQGDIFYNRTKSRDSSSGFSCYHVLYKTTTTKNDTFYQRVGASSTKKMVIPDGVTGYQFLFGRSSGNGVAISVGDAEANVSIDILRKGANFDDFEDLSNTVDVNSTQIASINTELTAVDERIDVNSTQIASINTELTAVDEKVDVQIASINTELTEVDKKINALNHLPELSWEYNKTISASGVISDSQYFALSKIIDCKSGDIFYNLTPSSDDSSGFSCYHVFYKTSNVKNDTFYQRIGASSNRKAVIPDGVTGYQFLFGRSASGGVYISDGDAESNVDLEITRKGLDYNDIKTDIKILCVGNSFSQDSVAYMPFILRGLTDKINLTMGIAYYGSGGIDDYVGFFNDDTPSITYNKLSADSDSWTSITSQTLKQILESEPWDIVTFQQKSTLQENWNSYGNLNTLIDDVVGYITLTHKKSARVGWLMPQIRYNTSTANSYANMIECVHKVLETTPCSFVIPCGTAIQYARQTNLDNLGDSSHLTYDGVHLQEGLPCLLSAYVTTIKILDLFGIGYKHIIGERTRPIQTWIVSHDIPGRNGTSIGVTEENVYLAQKLAIQAIKYPYGYGYGITVVDPTPTQGSSNAANSGAVWQLNEQLINELSRTYTEPYTPTFNVITGGITSTGGNYDNHPERARTQYISIESGKTYYIHLNTTAYTYIGAFLYSSTTQASVTRRIELLDNQNLIFTADENENYFRVDFKNSVDDTQEITEENRTAIHDALKLYTSDTDKIKEDVKSYSDYINGLVDYPTVNWKAFPQTTSDAYVLSWRGGFWGNNNTASNSTTAGAIRYWSWIGKQCEAIGTNYVEFIPPSEGHIILKEFESKTATELINQYEIAEPTVIKLHDTHIYRIYILGLTGEISTYLTEEFVNSIGIRPIYSVKDTNKAIRTGEFIRFTVKVNNTWSHTTETDTADHENGEEHDHLCILTLPESYTTNGAKTPLIMYCHGASCGITNSSWYGNGTGEGTAGDFLSMVRSFTAQGYAVFDVNNTRQVSSGFNDWGCLPLMSAYIKAWEYIKEKYNVSDKLYLLSASMGTPVALNMMKWYKGDILASLILAPRPMGIKGRWDDTYGEITDARKKELLVAWGFEPDSILEDSTYVVPSKESVFTADIDAKLRGFYHHENMVTISGTDYIFEKFPPTKVMVGTNDTGFLAEVREYFSALQNFGNYVNYREVAGQSHGAMCTLVNGDLRSEGLAWFERFRYAEPTENETV